MIISKYLDAISCLDVFTGVDKNVILKAFDDNRYEVRSYFKGQVIHLQGEIACYMDIILQGEVAIQKIESEGRILTVNVFSSMDIISANLVFSTKNQYPMTVMANADSKLLHMHRDLVLMLCRQSDIFMQRFITMISDRTVSLTGRIHDVTLKSIRQRLIDYVRYEYHLQKSKRLKLRESKKNLAQRFGIERSSLSRELNKMRRDGIVEYDANTITIIDETIL